MDQPLQLVSTRSLHTLTGLVTAILAIVAIMVPAIRRRSAFADRLLSRPGQLLETVFGDISKKILMLVLAVAAATVYAYCLMCPERKSLAAGGFEMNIFHVVAMLSMRVFPYFIIGCLAAGIIEKYFRAGRIPPPRTMIGNGIFASLIPVCSCAVVPIAEGMMHLHKIRIRAVITFLMVAPLLNPPVITLSMGTLGAEYLVLRVFVTFALAMATGVLVERWAGVEKEGERGVFSCRGCSRYVVKPEQARSALILGWNTTVRFLYYLLVGIGIGAVFTVYVPPALVSKYLASGYLGLMASVVLGIPIYMCSGEEIVILKPLMDMGLPMGHAIAFTVTGNAICITSIAVLVPAFGKRVTAILVGALFVGATAAGAIINCSHAILSLFVGPSG